MNEFHSPSGIPKDIEALVSNWMRIFLNPELVRAPSVCIDYVIAHEICHFKHPGHGRVFYGELEKLCPAWRNLQQRLESVDL